MPGQSGYGVAITFDSGFFGWITSVDWNGIERNALDVTNDASPSGFEQFIPSSLKSAGELEVDILWNPLVTPPIGNAAETITVTWPVPIGGSTSATWSCSGFMTKMGVAAPIKDKITAKCTIKFTGVPTFTPGT